MYLPSCVIYASYYPSQVKNNEGQNILDQIFWPVSFILIGFGIWQIEKKYEEPQEIVVVGQKLKLLNHSNNIWRSHTREDVIN